jgi:phosphate-selective porin O/P
MKLAVLSLSVFLCLIARDARAQEETGSRTSQEEPNGEQQEPGEEGEEEGDVKDKVESMGEAFTEMRNIVEALNRLKFSGYIQGQYVSDESSINEANGPNATRNRDQFSVRRGRLKAVYTANPTARLTLQIDAASSGVALRDAYIELIEPWTTWKNTLTAGQFKWPFGFEVLYSSGDREMPERSRVIRTLFPGERDRGVQISGLGMQERLRYYVALMNGTGTAQAFDFNEEKDLVGRLGYSLGPLDFAGSVYRGEDLVATTANPAGTSFDKDRDGVDFQLVTPIPGLGVRGEYIQGKERGADVNGWYLDVIENLGTRHQFVIRAEDYDPNTDLDNNAIMTVGGAYLFHWDANTKLTFAYEHPDTEGVDPDDDVTTIRLQYKF